MKHPKEKAHFAHRIMHDADGDFVEYWNPKKNLWVFCEICAVLDVEFSCDSVVSYDDTWCEPYKGTEK